ncbi:MAG: LPS assembly lipoprotein LptE [Alistipes putredinis]
MKAVLKYAIVVAAGLLLAGCGYKVNYSLSGASIPPDAKTFSVAYFPNNAPMVAPILSSTLTDALRDKFTRQTRLTQVDREAAISLSKARSPVILRRRLRFRVRPKRPC